MHGCGGKQYDPAVETTPAAGDANLRGHLREDLEWTCPIECELYPAGNLSPDPYLISPGLGVTVRCMDSVICLGLATMASGFWMMKRKWP